MISIPKKVKVGGLVYKVRQVDKVNRTNSPDSETVGLWEPRDTVIYLKKDMDRQAKELYFLHELFHAIFEHCNIEQAEDKVDLLAHALYMVAKDNPGVFDFD